MKKPIVIFYLMFCLFTFTHAWNSQKPADCVETDSINTCSFGFKLFGSTLAAIAPPIYWGVALNY